MHSHLRTKGSDIFRKILSRLLSQKENPTSERFLHGAMQALDFQGRKFLGERNRREPRGVKNLIRIRVADATEQARISQRSFESVVAPRQRPGEVIERRTKNLQSAWIERAQGLLSLHQMQ